MNPQTKTKVLFSVGSLLIVLGIIFASCFGLIFTKILNNALVISESSPLFAQYTEPTTPINVNYYFFNVTNPIDVKNYGVKPILEQVGPYVYNEKMTKVNFDFDDAAGTVSYYQKYTYFFNEDGTNGTLKDKITTLNTVMVLAAAVSYDNFLVREFVWPQIEEKMDLFQTFTAEELLFGGWELPTFNYDFSNYPFPILDATSGLQGTLYEILSQLGVNVHYLEDNKFGFMKGLNGSDTGLLKVNTGAKGMDEYMFIKEWKNTTSLDVWDDTFCDMINGTDGSMFSPGVGKGDMLRMFAPQFCRSSYMVYESDMLLQGLINAYRFVTPPELFMTTTGNPDNHCFCRPIPDSTEECPANGMMNFAPCFYGFPVVVSNPHFYQTDGAEFDKFEGLSPPDKELHETYIAVEPITGMAMSGAKKLQINLPLKRYGNLPSFQNVPEAIFPVFWVDQFAIISKEDANKFNKAMTLPFIVVYSICGVLILVGLILIIYGIVIYRKIKPINQRKGHIQKTGTKR